MSKRVLVLVGAFVTPGGLLALVLAWIMTRPDVQVRIEELWTRALRWAQRRPDQAPIVLHEVTVLEAPPVERPPDRCVGRRVGRPVVHVPVSRSRCHHTVVFAALRAA